MDVYYTTWNGDRSGRASHLYESEEKAKERAALQNKKAEEMDLDVRYAVAQSQNSDFDEKPR